MGQINKITPAISVSVCVSVRALMVVIFYFTGFRRNLAYVFGFGA